MSAADAAHTAEPRSVHVLGVPLDHGAGRRGVGMGPSVVRLSGLRGALERVGWTVTDEGDIPISIPETVAEGNPRAKYLSIVAGACEETSAKVLSILDDGGFPLIIGGDHSLSIGTISGVATHLRARATDRQPARLGVIWFDAHADINSPQTSSTGNIHGMPVSCLLGEGPEELTAIGFAGPKVNPERLVQIGLRDIDEHEKRRLKQWVKHVYTMEDIDRRRLFDVVGEAIALATDGCEHLHVSFDIDVLDPRIAPGTGTPKMGGLTYREAHLALEMIAGCGLLRSFELVEVNPILDEHNRTAELSVGLIASALGKRIL